MQGRQQFRDLVVEIPSQRSLGIEGFGAATLDTVPRLTRHARRPHPYTDVKYEIFNL